MTMLPMQLRIRTLHTKIPEPPSPKNRSRFVSGMRLRTLFLLVRMRMDICRATGISFIQYFQSFIDPHSSRNTTTGGTLEIHDTANIIFSSTLNIVFALGCQHSKLVSEADKHPLARTFYHRSRDLFIFEMLDSTSIPLVQLLLLQSLYLQSSEYANRCWNVVGHAIRAAQGLGFHLPIDRRSETQLARETRRRVWYTCVTLDR